MRSALRQHLACASTITLPPRETWISTRGSDPNPPRAPVMAVVSKSPAFLAAALKLPACSSSNINPARLSADNAALVRLISLITSFVFSNSAIPPSRFLPSMCTSSFSSAPCDWLAFFICSLSFFIFLFLLMAKEYVDRFHIVDTDIVRIA
ncbi:hypothetical protein D3C78_901270 [compost metagenome]